MTTQPVPIRCEHCRGTGNAHRLHVGDDNNTRRKMVRIACVHCGRKRSGAPSQRRTWPRQQLYRTATASPF